MYLFNGKPQASAFRRAADWNLPVAKLSSETRQEFRSCGLNRASPGTQRSPKDAHGSRIMRQKDLRAESLGDCRYSGMFHLPLALVRRQKTPTPAACR